MPKQTIHTRLRDLRLSRGDSQDLVAEACDMSRVALTRYENGSRIPRIEIAARLAEYYGVSVDYILGRDTPENTPPVSPASIPPRADFTDPAVMEMMTRDIDKLSPSNAALYLSIVDKIRKLDEDKLAQAEAFVAFLEAQDK